MPYAGWTGLMVFPYKGSRRYKSFSRQNKLLPKSGIEQERLSCTTPDSLPAPMERVQEDIELSAHDHARYAERDTCALVVPGVSYVGSESALLRRIPARRERNRVECFNQIIRYLDRNHQV